MSGAEAVVLALLASTMEKVVVEVVFAWPAVGVKLIWPRAVLTWASVPVSW